MPRPCRAGAPERDEQGRRLCYAFERKPVPTAGEVFYLKALAEWGVSIEAACVLTPRTDMSK